MEITKFDKVIKVGYSGVEDFYDKMLWFMSPLTGLRKKERKILSYILSIKNEWESRGMSRETIKRDLLKTKGVDMVAERFGLSSDYVRTIISAYKREGIIIDDEINPRLLFADPRPAASCRLCIILENEDHDA